MEEIITNNLEDHHNDEYESLMKRDISCGSTSDQTAYAIKGSELHKAYKTKKLIFFSDSNNVVLDKVTINIEKGKIYGLLGPSGCGKTTVCNLVIKLNLNQKNLFLLSI